jgi:hypothetical protein
MAVFRAKFFCVASKNDLGYNQLPGYAKCESSSVWLSPQEIYELNVLPEI